jgi:hypothetical protein
MKNSEIITLYPVGKEVFVVQSFETGLCDIYDNMPAARKHIDEMNRECPNDHYWVESWRIRSS